MSKKNLIAKPIISQISEEHKAMVLKRIQTAKEDPSKILSWEEAV